jgi:hypothetical protein
MVRGNRRNSREKAQKAQGSGAATKGRIDKIMGDEIMGAVGKRGISRERTHRSQRGSRNQSPRIDKDPKSEI